jgi:flagellar basal-body rod modification protein FlgD
LITSQINAYSYSSGASSSSTSTSTANSALDMSDYLTLLSEQMANQDILNPTDSTEYVSQMAQFSSLSAMNTLATTAASQLAEAKIQYGSLLVGATVTVSTTNSSGAATTVEGTVDSASFSSSGTTISIDGTSYDISSVVKVGLDSSSTTSSTTT